MKISPAIALTRTLTQTYTHPPTHPPTHPHTHTAVALHRGRPGASAVPRARHFQVRRSKAGIGAGYDVCVCPSLCDSVRVSAVALALHLPLFTTCWTTRIKSFLPLDGVMWRLLLPRLSLKGHKLPSSVHSVAFVCLGGRLPPTAKPHAHVRFTTSTITHSCSDPT